MLYVGLSSLFNRPGRSLTTNYGPLDSHTQLPSLVRAVAIIITSKPPPK